MEILHIVHKTDWEHAREAGVYTAESLTQEGFIHCSTAQQIGNTANRFYSGRRGLLLLHIDVEQLTSELRWEAADGEEFPHIYGPLNLDAVVKVEKIEPGADGMFHYPA